MFLGKACLAIINHPHRFEMGKKHPLFSLPMHFKNENKLADMVDILCEVEETLNVLWQRQEPKQMMSLEISFYVISAALLVEINWHISGQLLPDTWELAVTPLQTIYNSQSQTLFNSVRHCKIYSWLGKNNIVKFIFNVLHKICLLFPNKLLERWRWKPSRH